MDVCQAIKQRLQELDYEQRDLAAAVDVTESYISQLLSRKKLPPASDRTDIYPKMEKFLKFPAGKLSSVADHQRREALNRSLDEAPQALLKEVRALILRKCGDQKQREVRAIFEGQPFGELERLVSQRLLEVTKKIAQEELNSESRLRTVAQLAGRSYKEIRVAVLDFLDTDVFNLSAESCDCFLDPLIESWDIDLDSFAMNIVLNRRLASAAALKFEFVEKKVYPAAADGEGFTEFLQDPALSGDATKEELEFLESLAFNGRQPTPLYYYRELQNLRDPLHFCNPPLRDAPTPKASPRTERAIAPLQNWREAKGIEKQLQLNDKKMAMERWQNKRGKRGRNANKLRNPGRMAM